MLDNMVLKSALDRLSLYLVLVLQIATVALALLFLSHCQVIIL